LNRFPLPSELNLIGQEKPELPPWPDLPAVKKKWKPRIYSVFSNVIISDVEAILNLIESLVRPKIPSSLQLHGANKALPVVAKDDEVAKPLGKAMLCLVVRTSNYGKQVRVKAVQHQFTTLVLTSVYDAAILVPD
jgi:hypothetical protein